MNRFYKYSTFFLSYTPLWITICYIDMMNLFYHKTSNPWTERITIVILIVLSILSIVNVADSLGSLKKEGSEKVTIKQAQEEKTAVLEYVLTFILPMFAFEFTQWEKIIPFLIYFIFLLILSCRHNLLVSNIALDIIGFSSYRIVAINDYGKEIDRVIISRRKLYNSVNDEIFIVAMNKDFYYDVTKK